MTLAEIVKCLGKVSYAEAEEFILDIRRRDVLSMHQKPLKTIINEQLKAWEARAPVKKPQFRYGSLING